MRKSPISERGQFYPQKIEAILFSAFFHLIPSYPQPILPKEACRRRETPSSAYSLYSKKTSNNTYKTRNFNTYPRSYAQSKEQLIPLSAGCEILPSAISPFLPSAVSDEDSSSRRLNTVNNLDRIEQPVFRPQTALSVTISLLISDVALTSLITVMSDKPPPAFFFPPLRHRYFAVREAER